MPLDQRIIDLYDQYTHYGMDRRDFIDGVVKITGSVAAAMAAIDLVAPNYALAQMVKPDDPRLDARMVSYQGAQLMQAYLVRPRGAVRLPGIMVIHENRGLNAHIQDVARRLALEGFTVLAPDALSPLGGAPADGDQAIKMIAEVGKDMPTVVRNFAAGVDYLKGHEGTTGKVGVTGFCWGGAMTNMMAVNSNADAFVVYYGRAPNAADVPKIKAPLMIHLAGNDPNVNNTYPAYEEALKANNKPYTKHVYEGAQHAFNNDTSEARYNKAAADQAWQRTVAFFKQHLS